MDYDFEAPTYVNFAEAMDEDESEISKYFDVEHEESFSRVRSTPGVMLPAGLRGASSAKKVSGKEMTPSHSEKESNMKCAASPKECSEDKKTPRQTSRSSKALPNRRSSGRLKTPSVKTPLKAKTPTSVKRLGGRKVSSVTPRKVAAALTALKLTPTPRLIKKPESAKRLRNDTQEQPLVSPAKRVKLSPNPIVASVTNLEVSPAALNVTGLLNQAVKTLNNSSRKKKIGLTGHLVSTIDGIEVPYIHEKEHAMETRSDKAARDPPIQLRSRSVTKMSSDVSGTTRKSLNRSQVRSHSSDRKVPASQGAGARSRSIDRLRNPTQASKAPEPFISLAEATIRFQNRTPLRFRAKRRNSPAVKVQGPMLALRATIPQSPALRVKHRNRPITAMSREEREALELEEISKHKIKALPMPEKIFKTVNHIPKLEKKPPTQPEPFNITEVRKKEPSPAPEPAKFTARPVPKKILEGPVGIAEKKQVPLTEPKSPSFRANALKRSKEITQRTTPLKHINKVTMKVVLEEHGGVQVVKEKQLGHLGVPYTVQKTATTTEVKPFSFEIRDKERMQRKEEKLKELEKKLLAKPTFHANPPPSFKTPPRFRIASPATRSKTPSGLKDGNVAQKMTASAPKQKPALIPQFKARAPTVLSRKPFEPVKPNRQLPLPDITLASEIRAKDREIFDEQLMQREQEFEAARQQLKAEKEKMEKEEIALLRKKAVHKPNPVPKVKPFEPQPSAKPLTDPNTPFCLKRSRKLSNL